GGGGAHRGRRVSSRRPRRAPGQHERDHRGTDPGNPPHGDSVPKDPGAVDPQGSSGATTASTATVAPTTASTASSGWKPSQSSSLASKTTSPTPANTDRARAPTPDRACHQPVRR